MARKGKSAAVKVIGVAQKVNPIPRGRDNTDDLLDEVEATHARYSHIKHPDAIRKGSFDPSDNTAYNGSTVVAPTT